MKTSLIIKFLTLSCILCLTECKNFQSISKQESNQIFKTRKKRNINTVISSCVDNSCDSAELTNLFSNDESNIEALYPTDTSIAVTNLGANHFDPSTQNTERINQAVTDFTNLRDQPCDFYHSQISKGSANSDLCYQYNFINNIDCNVVGSFEKTCNCPSILSGDYCDISTCNPGCNTQNTQTSNCIEDILSQNIVAECICKTATILKNIGNGNVVQTDGQEITTSEFMFSGNTCDQSLNLCNLDRDECDRTTTNCVMEVVNGGYRCEPKSGYDVIPGNYQQGIAWTSKAETTTTTASTTVVPTTVAPTTVTPSTVAATTSSSPTTVTVAVTSQNVVLTTTISSLQTPLLSPFVTDTTTTTVATTTVSLTTTSSSPTIATIPVTTQSTASNTTSPPTSFFVSSSASEVATSKPVTENSTESKLDDNSQTIQVPGNVAATTTTRPNIKNDEPGSSISVPAIIGIVIGSLTLVGFTETY